MGVSGSGKSTYGERIAARLGLPFVEGDDFHPEHNVAKMAAGHPLDDADRAPWLATLAQVLAKAESTGGCVLACSALKRRYRETLGSRLSAKPTVVFCHAPQEVLLARLQSRQNHFFPPELLDSQFEALEEPRGAIRVDVTRPIEAGVTEALEALAS